VEAAALPDRHGAVRREPRRPLEPLGPTEQPTAEMLASLGHELRTPLASLRATLDLLGADHTAPVSPVDEAALVARLQEELERLERLVENLSTLALVDAGRLSIAPRRVVAVAIAERALSLVAPTLERSGQRARLIAPVPGLEVQADPQRLTQALENLLTNASHSSPHGATIELVVERRGTAVELRVTDQGPGVPARRRARIWSRRHDGQSPGAGGLGLPLVRTLVELQGGTVGLDSSAGGASFWMRLPGVRAYLRTNASGSPALR
jgi:signal transduction histidine kinase